MHVKLRYRFAVRAAHAKDKGARLDTLFRTGARGVLGVLAVSGPCLSEYILRFCIASGDTESFNGQDPAEVLA